MLTTLYGPPPWMTQQGFVLGRDLDPAYRDELAEYLVSWLRYLREEAQLPVAYLSLHNEGDAYYRWPRDGSNPGEDHRDFNLYWPPEQVVDLLPRIRAALDTAGLEAVGLTPGETQNWYRFDEWGYARAILQDSAALAALSLVSSHSFAFDWNRENIYYGDYRNNGLRYLRARKPDLPAWVTSMSWGKMDVDFVENIRRNLYLTGVNGLIPWALMQRPAQWVGGDPNPGTAIRVSEAGDYELLPGYYFYKQVCRAGQPGMAVAAAYSLDPAVSLIAFASQGSGHPDAFIVLNRAEEAKQTEIRVKGSEATSFVAFRTGPEEHYAPLGTFDFASQPLTYRAPARSVTTFFAQEP